MFPNQYGAYNQQVYNNPQNNLNNNYGVCRVCQVSSLAEVQSCIVPLDGQITYFPCPAEQCIYTKVIGLNGTPVVQKYTPALVENTENSYSINNEVTQLARRVAYLEGVIGNVQLTTNNATNANDQSKSANTNDQPKSATQSITNSK